MSNILSIVAQMADVDPICYPYHVLVQHREGIDKFKKIAGRATTKEDDEMAEQLNACESLLQARINHYNYDNCQVPQLLQAVVHQGGRYTAFARSLIDSASTPAEYLMKLFVGLTLVERGRTTDIDELLQAAMQQIVARMNGNPVLALQHGNGRGAFLKAVVQN